MVQMTIEMPEGVLAALREDPTSFVRELRLTAAVKWYEMRRISQRRAAEIAGVSRSEFIAALGYYEVFPFQSSAEEIIEEADVGGAFADPSI
jgi:predicted HTH domain antitoxin